MAPMTRPVNSPRQMALKQTLQRNVFHKPTAPKGPVPQGGHVPEPPRPPVEAAEKAPAPASVPSGPKVGRNDPCPCGSGKKYKKCCG